MPWWAWVAIGGAYATLWRVVFRWLWRDESCHGWDEFWECAVTATFLGWFVAVAAVAYEVGRLIAGRYEPERAVRIVGGESRAMRRERRERELRERETRVRELERSNELRARELGIG